MLTPTRKKEAIKDLKMLHGIPSMGFCTGDGYFANSLVSKYGMSVTELEKEVGFSEIVKEWRKVCKQFE